MAHMRSRLSGTVDFSRCSRGVLVTQPLLAALVPRDLGHAVFLRGAACAWAGACERGAACHWLDCPPAGCWAMRCFCSQSCRIFCVASLPQSSLMSSNSRRADHCEVAPRHVSRHVVAYFDVESAFACSALIRPISRYNRLMSLHRTLPWDVCGNGTNSLQRPYYIFTRVQYISSHGTRTER